MNTTIVNPELLNQILTVVTNNEELFVEMWAAEISKAEDKEEVQELLKTFAHYNGILQNLKASCEAQDYRMSPKDLLDLADTFADIIVYNQDDERVNAEIQWFVETLTNLSKELN